MKKPIGAEAPMFRICESIRDHLDRDHAERFALRSKGRLRRRLVRHFFPSPLRRLDLANGSARDIRASQHVDIAHAVELGEPRKPTALHLPYHKLADTAVGQEVHIGGLLKGGVTFDAHGFSIVEGIEDQLWAAGGDKQTKHNHATHEFIRGIQVRQKKANAIGERSDNQRIHHACESIGMDRFKTLVGRDR